MLKRPAVLFLIIAFGTSAACAKNAPSTPRPAAAPPAAAPAPQTQDPNRPLAPAPSADRKPDVIYVPTPPEVVDAMLRLAKVTKDDVVYDLGSGDGRIPITAAKKFGARGVGFEIADDRLAEAAANLKAAGVGDKVRFVKADLFEADLSEATVITLYLLPVLNMKLRPTLQKLKPGTRIVSQSFDMDDWKPEATELVNGRTVYLWIVGKGH